MSRTPRPRRSRLLRRLGLVLAALLLVGGIAAVVLRDRVVEEAKNVARDLFADTEALPFEKSLLANSPARYPTSLDFGPDGRLYVAQQDGLIRAFTIERRGPSDYAVTDAESITAIQRIPNHNDDGRPNPGLRERLVTGILLTGTRERPVLWATSSDRRVGGGPARKDLDLDTNSGMVSRLDRAGGGWQRRDLVRGLPRSEENHAPNGLALDERTNMLYVAQGSNANAGAPSGHFAYLPQYALSGAVLAIDLDRLGDEPYDLPTLDDETRPGKADSNDPFGGNDGRNQARLVEGGPVQVYSPGFRNPYDIVLAANGRLYLTDNGGNPGNGGVPVGEGPGGRCTNAPNERRSPPANRDSLHLIARQGYYGGIPNPTRGNRANRFNRDRQSPVPRANAVECDYVPPEQRPALTLFNESTNGLTEYTASNLDGVLTGDLLTPSLNNIVYRLKLDDAGTRLSLREGLFSNVTRAPGFQLDLTAQGDTDAFGGTIWLCDYANSEIFVFEPNDYEEHAAAPGAWSRQPPSGLARQEVSYVEAGGKLYLAGGSRRHQAYDPARGSWRDVAPLPAKLDHIQGVEVDGLVLYIGGLAGFPGPSVGSVWIYDPARNAFRRGAPMPRPRGAGAVAVRDGTILYAGGLSDGQAVPWVDAYDPEADRWSRLPDMPRPRDHFGVAVVDDRLYAVGGRSLELGETTTETDAYSFESGAWETGLASMPTARGGFATAVVGQEIVVFGGEVEKGALSSVEAYDPATDRWRELRAMPTARHGIQAAVCGGSVYVAAGGRTPGGDSPTSLHERFELAERADTCF